MSINQPTPPERWMPTDEEIEQALGRLRKQWPRRLRWHRRWPFLTYRREMPGIWWTIHHEPEA